MKGQQPHSIIRMEVKLLPKYREHQLSYKKVKTVLGNVNKPTSSPKLQIKVSGQCPHQASNQDQWWSALHDPKLKNMETQSREHADTRSNSWVGLKCAFGFKLKSQIILLFSLFLLLFMGFTALFGTTHRSHCTFSVNFYIYL